MPAAAVIPARIAYIKVAAVKKLVVGFRGSSKRRGPAPLKRSSYCAFLPLPWGDLIRPALHFLLFHTISFGGWLWGEGGGILGRVRSAWGVRSVARLRLFTELRRYSLHHFCGRSCSLLLALSGVGGRTWKSQPRLVKVGFCFRPIWSFLLSTLLHQLSHLVFLFSGASCRWRDLPCGTGGC